MPQPSGRPPITIILAGLALVALWLGAIGWTVWSLEEEPDERSVSAEAFDRTTSDVELLADEVSVLRGQVSSLRAEIADFEAQMADDAAMDGASDDADLSESSDTPTLTEPEAEAPADGADGADEADTSADADATDGTSGLAGPPQSAAPAAPTPAVPRTVVTNGQDLWSCSDFTSWEQAQAVFKANEPGDPNKIDSNGDDIACERLWREAQAAETAGTGAETAGTATPEATATGE